MDECIFCKISKHEVPKEFTYEDDEVMVFPDINPIKPIHLLVVSKKHIPDFSQIKDLERKMFETVRNVIKEKGLSEGGYRLVINGGGAQVIDHLHIHVLGPMGQKVGW